MNTRRSSRVPFSPDRVEQAIKHSGLKKKDLFPELHDDRRGKEQMLARPYRRCKKEKLIKPANLEWLARKLGVATAYLAGELDWPLNELPNEELKKAYRDKILDPARFPYEGWYQLRNRVDYEEYERQLLEVHGIERSRLAALSTYEQLSLLEEIDGVVCKKLREVFPDCIKIDYYDIFQGYDVDDIIEILIDDLLDEMPEEEIEEQEDPFALKYMPERVCKSFWKHEYTLAVHIEGDEASSWQAVAVSEIANNQRMPLEIDDRLRGFLSELFPALSEADLHDLYWTVRPKLLIAKDSCSNNARDVVIRCDCKVGTVHQLDIKFHNEELIGFNLA